MPRASTPSMRGPARNPFVGVGAGLGHARFHLHELPAAAGAALAHFAIANRLRDRRIPSAKKIAAEGDQVIGASEIESGKRGHAEAQEIGLAQDGFVQRLIGDGGRRAERFQESLDQFAALASERAREEGQGSGVSGMNFGEMRGQLGERLVPGDFLEIARAARATELQRIRQAIGMIENLKTGLASRAELAAVNRMLGIALELFRQTHLDDAGLTIANDFRVALHDPDQRAATGRAQRAYAGFPSGDSGDEIFVGNETNQLVLGAAARLEGRERSRESRNFEEVTPFHFS